MADRDDALEIERQVELCERVRSRRHVRECLRPASASTGAPVFEVPRRDTLGRKVRADVRHERAVVARSPVAAVQDDGDAVRSFSPREEELAELAAIGPVPVDRAFDPGQRLI